MTKNELAIKEFRSGYNCAQAVLAAFVDEIKIDKSTVLKLSTGFGAGMGRLQGTCGAVTGAFMTIGAFIGNTVKDNSERKAKTYKIIQAYNEMFLALHKTTDCKDLLGCNLRTPEGQAYFNDNKLSEKICEKCVSDSVDILKEILI